MSFISADGQRPTSSTPVGMSVRSRTAIGGSSRVSSRRANGQRGSVPALRVSREGFEDSRVPDVRQLERIGSRSSRGSSPFTVAGLDALYADPELALELFDSVL